MLLPSCGLSRILCKSPKFSLSRMGIFQDVMPLEDEIDVRVWLVSLDPSMAFIN